MTNVEGIGSHTAYRCAKTGENVTVNFLAEYTCSLCGQERHVK
jgi:hypothetical protein